MGLPSTHHPAAVALLLPLLGGLGACEADSACDTAIDVCESDDNTEAYDGELRIDEVRWQCCDPAENESCGQAWAWYDVITSGTADRTTLDIEDSAAALGDWSEQHPLESQSSDPDGYWDSRYSELTIADTSDCAGLSDCADRFEAGSTTLFPCTDAWTQSRMTWTVKVFEADAVTATHCVTWGAQPTDAGGCEVWTVTQ